MDQLPYQKHSETSREASESMIPNAGTLRAKVFEFIKEHSPCTDEEIQIGLSMNPSTQRPRRVELLRSGLITASGYKLTRSGRKATAWISK